MHARVPLQPTRAVTDFSDVVDRSDVVLQALHGGHRLTPSQMAAATQVGISSWQFQRKGCWMREAS